MGSCGSTGVSGDEMDRHQQIEKELKEHRKAITTEIKV
jgi:hypothetical protein